MNIEYKKNNKLKKNCNDFYICGTKYNIILERMKCLRYTVIKRCNELCYNWIITG